VYIRNSGGHRIRSDEGCCQPQQARYFVSGSGRVISLAEAAEFDFTAAVVTRDERFDYGEVRFRAFAYVNGQGRCLVFTAISSTTIRAVSYRRARQKEMQRYGL
jgi:hypothetical protein